MESLSLVPPVLSLLVLGFAICSLVAYLSRRNAFVGRDRNVYLFFVLSIGLCSGVAGAMDITAAMLGSRHQQRFWLAAASLRYLVQTEPALCSFLSLLLHQRTLSDLVMPITWFINTLLTLFPIVHLLFYRRRQNSHQLIPVYLVWAGQLLAVACSASNLLGGHTPQVLYALFLTIWTCCIISALHDSPSTASVRSVSWCSPVLPPTPSRDFFDRNDPFAFSLAAPPAAHVRARASRNEPLYLSTLETLRRKFRGKKRAGNPPTLHDAAIASHCWSTYSKSAYSQDSYRSGQQLGGSSSVDMEFSEEETVFILRTFDLLPKTPPGIPHIPDQPSDAKPMDTSSLGEPWRKTRTPTIGGRTYASSAKAGMGVNYDAGRHKQYQKDADCPPDILAQVVHIRTPRFIVRCDACLGRI
ncbi:hypothetical protein GLOTRDRAFT_92247 [Gloeophyllum trabeum ATCC 11539]|uniref:Uncharacterized protein n=1 Tax=Gloeophyllum trabeum (strain ATCC 11539 / FP-39264 / Madison 617) TaxID=670483 RepID=S7QCN1_GLOTA|nr:uncharacterized protein GLOTRDRAFT_92247 [Gloeophyllum trabeum ATCC 11539]EPQ57107.1 hypothetical protein GLOTRDRAFT_92247 [Gloeophyllum trabeum ATCC 11539]